MADIIREIDTIGDLLKPVDVTRFYKQTYPAKYVSNTIGIRWEQDADMSETGAHYVIDRLYQIVYFGTSEVDCLRKIPQITRLINQQPKIKIGDTGDFMTLVSFNMSQPFKTETDGVYATVGVLATKTRVLRDLPQHQKMAEINTDINGGGN